MPLIGDEPRTALSLLPLEVSKTPHLSAVQLDDSGEDHADRLTPACWRAGPSVFGERCPLGAPRPEDLDPANPEALKDLAHERYMAGRARRANAE